MLNDGRGFNDAFEEQIGLQAESKYFNKHVTWFFNNFFLGASGQYDFFSAGQTTAEKTVFSRSLM